MRAGATEAKIAEVPTALTSELFDEREKTALEYAEAMTFTDRKVTEDLFARVQRELEVRKVHCVLVDEAQFLSRDQVYQLTEVVDRLEIPVLCFGLRTDFQGELFEGSRYLLGWADQLEEIKSICHTGRKATMVVRVDEAGYAIREGRQVEIGGNERYVSVSRKAFKEVFHGGKRVRTVEPVASEPADPEGPGLHDLLVWPDLQRRHLHGHRRWRRQQRHRRRRSGERLRLLDLPQWLLRLAGQLPFAGQHVSVLRLARQQLRRLSGRHVRRPVRLSLLLSDRVAPAIRP